MTEENNTTTPPQAPKEDTSTKGADASGKNTVSEWKTITGEKFESEAEFAKAYINLQKKLGEQGSELKQSREFVTAIQPLLETIREDPDLFKTLDEKIRKRTQQVPSSANAGEGKTTSQDDVRSVTQDLILEKFEEKYGITKLSSDEQKNMRAVIGKQILRQTGRTLTDVDLRQLPTVLEDAYFLANKDKLVEKSKQEALLAAQGVDEAGIPSMPSTQGKGEETLTPQELRVAAKMGLTREQYIEGKKKSGR